MRRRHFLQQAALALASVAFLGVRVPEVVAEDAFGQLYAPGLAKAMSTLRKNLIFDDMVSEPRTVQWTIPADPFDFS